MRGGADKARAKELVKGVLCVPLFALVAVLVLVAARRHAAEQSWAGGR